MKAQGGFLYLRSQDEYATMPHMRIWQTITMISAAGATLGTPAMADSQAQHLPEDKLQLFVGKLNAFYSLLDSIHDRSSADAAAPQVAKLMNEVINLHDSIENIDTQQIDNKLISIGITPEKTAGIFNRLERTRCYGSEALAEALNISAQPEPIETTPTPEFTEALGTLLMQTLDGQLNGITGGPGLTEQTAWNLGNKEENLACIATIMNAIPGAIKVDQNLVTTDSGAIYGRMRFKFPFRNHLYPLEMWFNLTHIPSAQKAVQKASKN